MKSPKPILSDSKNVKISIIGYNRKYSLPYLVVDFVEGEAWRWDYILDRDVKRLHKWTNFILKKLKEKKMK